MAILFDSGSTLRYIPPILAHLHGYRFWCIWTWWMTWVNFCSPLGSVCLKIWVISWHWNYHDWYHSQIMLITLVIRQNEREMCITKSHLMFYHPGNGYEDVTRCRIEYKLEGRLHSWLVSISNFNKTAGSIALKIFEVATGWIIF